MIKYFTNLIINLKTKTSFNVVEEYNHSTIDLEAISGLSKLIEYRKSIPLEDHMYEQRISKNLVINWCYENGKETIRSIKSDQYSLLFAAKVFILKVIDNRIKDLRFDLKTGLIKKINFTKSYFIRFVDFYTGHIAMSIPDFSIKAFFAKERLSDLSQDEWELLELNTLH